MSMFFRICCILFSFLCFHDHGSFQIKSAIIIEDIVTAPLPKLSSKECKKPKNFGTRTERPWKSESLRVAKRDPLRTLFYNYVKGKSATNPSFLVAPPN